MTRPSASPFYTSFYEHAPYYNYSILQPSRYNSFTHVSENEKSKLATTRMSATTISTAFSTHTSSTSTTVSTNLHDTTINTQHTHKLLAHDLQLVPRSLSNQYQVHCHWSTPLVTTATLAPTDYNQNIIIGGDLFRPPSPSSLSTSLPNKLY